MKRIIAILMLISMMITLCACSHGEDEIKTTLKEFEVACQALDARGMLDCIDPDVARPVSNGLSLVGLFTDIDTEDLIGKIFDLIFDKDVEPSEFLSGLEFTKLEINSDGKKADVMCILVAKIGGERMEFKSEVGMLYTEEHWYISGIRFI